MYKCIKINHRSTFKAICMCTYLHVHQYLGIHFPRAVTLLDRNEYSKQQKTSQPLRFWTWSAKAIWTMLKPSSTRLGRCKGSDKGSPSSHLKCHQEKSLSALVLWQKRHHRAEKQEAPCFLTISQLKSRTAWVSRFSPAGRKQATRHQGAGEQGCWFNFCGFFCTWCILMYLDVGVDHFWFKQCEWTRQWTVFFCSRLGSEICSFDKLLDKIRHSIRRWLPLCLSPRQPWQWTAWALELQCSPLARRRISFC